MNKKCAIITGGSRGIGRAICTKLAKETDYHILINYQSNKEAALETLESIQSLGKIGEIIKFDVTNHQEVKIALEQWQENNKESVVEVITSCSMITPSVCIFTARLDCDIRRDWRNSLTRSPHMFLCPLYSNFFTSLHRLPLW